MSVLKTVPVSQVRVLPRALRVVDPTTVNFAMLRDNIEQYGILNPISVTEGLDDQGQVVYNVLDGAHRFQAAKELGWKEIGVNVTDHDEVARKLAQISGNLQTIPTRPVEYTKMLLQVLDVKPTWDMSDLARHVNQSTAWLKDRLKLLHLTEPIQKLVDENKITLVNAFNLAKLPQNVQEGLAEDAVQMSTQEFSAKVGSVKSALAAEAKTGVKADPNAFVHKPHLRKMSEIEAEKESGTARQTIAQQVAAEATSVIEAAELGFMQAILWMTHSDALSVKVAKEQHEQRVASRAKEREEAAKQRQAKSSAGAKLMQLELDMRRAGMPENDIQAALEKARAEVQPV